jgi:hypothetical protein
VTVLVDLTGIPGDIVDDDLGLQSRCQHPPATDEDGLEQRPARTHHVAGSLESSLLSTTLKHGRVFPPARQRWSSSEFGFLAIIFRERAPSLIHRPLIIAPSAPSEVTNAEGQHDSSASENLIVGATLECDPDHGLRSLSVEPSKPDIPQCRRQPLCTTTLFAPSEECGDKEDWSAVHSGLRLQRG